MQVVEMTNNQLVQVLGKAEADHLFQGIEVKYAKGGTYVPKAKARPALFSRAHVWRTLQQV